MPETRLKGSKSTVLLMGALVLFLVMAYGGGREPGAALFSGPSGPARGGQQEFGPSRMAGVIESLSGQVVFRRSPGNLPRLAAGGDAVYTSDIVQTLPGSRCVLRLAEREFAVLGPLAAFQIDESSHRPGAEKRHYHFTVFSGECLFYLPLTFEYRDARTRVRTPTATVAVRSARFALDILTPKHRALRGWGPPRGKPPPRGVKNRNIQMTALCLDGEIRLRHASSGGELTLTGGSMSFSDCLSLGPSRDLDRAYARRLATEALGPGPLLSIFTGKPKPRPIAPQVPPGFAR